MTQPRRSRARGTETKKPAPAPPPAAPVTPPAPAEEWPRQVAPYAWVTSDGQRWNDRTEAGRHQAAL